MTGWRRWRCVSPGTLIRAGRAPGDVRLPRGEAPIAPVDCANEDFPYPAVKNLSIAARRKRGRFSGDEEALLAIPAREGAGDPRDDLAQALSMLPVAQREALLMRFVDEMSLEEIASALDIPLGTVKSRLHNALESLRADGRTRKYFGIE